MSKHIYPKLAWQNLRKNGKFYIPYIFTVIGTSAAFYILLALSATTSLPDKIRYQYLEVYMYLGLVVIGIFSFIFLFYTNSFLIKRRNKELGLYNILGMDKSHIGRMLAYETLYTGLFGITGGIVFGILLQKLATLLLGHLAGFDIQFGFYIYYGGIAITFCFFFAILIINLICNLFRIHTQDPIQIIRAGSTGEKEPKVKIFVTLLGIVTLGAGYYIAMTAKTAIDAFAFYFLAVILVIIGTYCLFTAISIAVLKLMRKNKKYYYKTSHFINISGMLYRMKRNAVGLANICILSTMVLVMVSATLSLYLGTDDMVKTSIPTDYTVYVDYNIDPENPYNSENMEKHLVDMIESQGLEITSLNIGDTMAIPANYTDSVIDVSSQDRIANINFMTLENYRILSDPDCGDLKENEIIVIGPYDYLTADRISFVGSKGEREFDVKSRIDGGKNMENTYVVVVSDKSVIDSLYGTTESYMEDGMPVYQGSLNQIFYINSTGTDEEKINCTENFTFLDETGELGIGMYNYVSTNNQQEMLSEVKSMNGGFFFLGIFLGIVFILGTVLIIYYKQISEGYEDATRFDIMQKVGLDKKDIRRSISSQILVVFFMPLIVAAIHVIFDFRLIDMMLTLFTITNTSLTLWCTVGAFGGFVVIYVLAFILTARSYYKIVS